MKWIVRFWNHFQGLDRKQLDAVLAFVGFIAALFWGPDDGFLSAVLMAYIGILLFLRMLSALLIKEGE